MLRLALAQVNTTVGDLEGNAETVLRFLRKAESMGADLVCFPELALCGYPPEDLVLKRDFVTGNMTAIERLAREVREVPVIIGALHLDDDLYNSAAVLWKGKIVAWYHKNLLPNYGVFDEARYFAPGESGLVLKIGDERVGITICEDIWYPGGPLEEEVAYGGAELVVNISSSPFQRGKQGQRKKMLFSRASDNSTILAYVNCVGGQDELIFDGGSMVVHPERGLASSAPRFREHLLVADVDTSGLWGKRMLAPTYRHARKAAFRHSLQVIEIEKPSGKPRESCTPLSTQDAVDVTGEEEILQALLLGLSDYVKKNGFQDVVIGLSGGVDSSLTAAIAVMALGRSRVHGVFMPSRFTSDISREGVTRLVENLGIDFEGYSIDPILESYLAKASRAFRGRWSSVALENLQARIRGNILMGISNSRGWLVLSTGNKSELSMGYCTLYGDMAGGFAVIKDLLKVQVYRLCAHINQRSKKEIIPSIILSREPTAELREGQRDSESLPPYEDLDPILEDYIENGLSLEEMVHKGYDRSLVEDVIRRVDANEYKRRQAPVGVKITSRAFGRDWRLPISIHKP